MERRQYRCQIPVAEGVKLDGVVYTNNIAPSSSDTEGPLCMVVLHPYPLLGGCMSDPTVAAICRAAASSGRFAAVLRYNQRGVGGSGGGRSLWGTRDVEDLPCVLTWLTAAVADGGGSAAAEQAGNVAAGPEGDVAIASSAPLQPGQQQEEGKRAARVVVVGYSWGSCVAAHAAGLPGVEAYVGVSFPAGGMSISGLLASCVLSPASHLAHVTAASALPRLLVLGLQDQFTSAERLLQAVRDGAAVARDGSSGSDRGGSCCYPVVGGKRAGGAGKQVSGGGDAHATAAAAEGAGDGADKGGEQVGREAKWGAALSMRHLVCGGIDVLLAPECDHFWGGAWEQVGAAVVGWVLDKHA